MLSPSFCCVFSPLQAAAQPGQGTVVAPAIHTRDQQAVPIPSTGFGPAAVYDGLVSSRSASSVSLHDVTIRASVSEMLLPRDEAIETGSTAHTSAADAQSQAEAGGSFQSSSAQAVQTQAPVAASSSRPTQEQRTATPYRSRMVGTERSPSATPSPPMSARGSGQQPLHQAQPQQHSRTMTSLATAVQTQEPADAPLPAQAAGPSGQVRPSLAVADFARLSHALLVAMPSDLGCVQNQHSFMDNVEHLLP